MLVLGWRLWGLGWVGVLGLVEGNGNEGDVGE